MRPRGGLSGPLASVVGLRGTDRCFVRLSFKGLHAPYHKGKRTGPRHGQHPPGRRASSGRAAGSATCSRDPRHAALLAMLRSRHRPTGMQPAFQQATRQGCRLPPLGVQRHRRPRATRRFVQQWPVDLLDQSGFISHGGNRRPVLAPKPTAGPQASRSSPADHTLCFPRPVRGPLRSDEVAGRLRSTRWAAHRPPPPCCQGTPSAFCRPTTAARQPFVV